MVSFLPIPPFVPGMEFRLFAAVIFTAATAYFDVFNKKWVPNYLIYAFAICAVALNFIFYDPIVTFQALAFGIGIFILTYPLYKMGQLGGADVFVLASIAAAVPYFQKPLFAAEQLVQYPFILSVLVPTSLLFIFHMLIRFIPHVSGQMRQGKLKITFGKIVGPALLLVSFSFFIYVISTMPLALPFSYVFVMSFLFISLIFFSFFKEEIKDSMIEMVSPSRLVEEDVIALEKMDSALVKKLSLKPLLEAKEIATLKKARLKGVPVYTGMPFFLPYLLAGLLITILFGDLLYYIVAL